MAKALIVGSGGQDGQLLKSFLLDKNYQLVLIDRCSGIDIQSEVEVEKLIKKELPDEIYYLAAFHHSSQDKKPNNLLLFRKSFDINLFGILNFLEAVRRYSKKTKIFYAASSHIFGNSDEPIQEEHTPISPTNIYGISKSSALFACRYYRETYGLFVSVGILYNHESHLRKSSFLSKKICSSVANIKYGNLKKLELANTNSSIDFGYAPDFIDAMWRILSIDEPDEFIIATGEKHSIEEFIKIAFNEVGLDYNNYINIQDSTSSDKASSLVGSMEKLSKLTGWKPSLSFEEMVVLLVKYEVNKISNNQKKRNL